LDQVEKVHLYQIKQLAKEVRFEAALNRAGVATELGRFWIRDYSPNGFRVHGANQIGRRVVLQVELHTSESSIDSRLRRLMLHAITVEVRWCRANPTGGYDHGLRLVGLNHEQKKVIFECLQELYSPTLVSA
jgi:hypothetical protein